MYIVYILCVGTGMYMYVCTHHVSSWCMYILHATCMYVYCILLHMLHVNLVRRVHVNLVELAKSFLSRIYDTCSSLGTGINKWWIQSPSQEEMRNGEESREGEIIPPLWSPVQPPTRPVYIYMYVCIFEDTALLLVGGVQFMYYVHQRSECTYRHLLYGI